MEVTSCCSQLAPWFAGCELDRCGFLLRVPPQHVKPYEASRQSFRYQSNTIIREMPADLLTGIVPPSGCRISLGPLSTTIRSKRMATPAVATIMIANFCNNFTCHAPSRPPWRRDIYLSAFASMRCDAVNSAKICSNVVDRG